MRPEMIRDGRKIADIVDELGKILPLSNERKRKILQDASQQALSPVYGGIPSAAWHSARSAWGLPPAVLCRRWPRPSSRKRLTCWRFLTRSALPCRSKRLPTFEGLEPTLSAVLYRAACAFSRAEEE